MCSGDPRLAEYGFLERNWGQLPGARGRRTHVGVDVHVDDARSVILDRLLKRTAQIFALRHGDAISAAGTCPGRKIGVVGLAAALSLIKGSAMFAAVEKSVLDVANRTSGKVIPDHPDAGQIEFNCGAQNIRCHRKTTIAHHCNAGSLWRGKFGAEHATNAETHR